MRHCSRYDYGPKGRDFLLHSLNWGKDCLGLADSGCAGGKRFGLGQENCLFGVSFGPFSSVLERSKDKLKVLGGL